MNRKEQMTLARDLSKSILGSFQRAQQAGEVPEDWDGIEIRQWLADTYARETYPQLMKGKRGKEYRNRVAVSANL